MTQIQLLNVTGYTPIDVYMADYNGNYVTYLGTITGDTILPVPPIVDYYPSSFFDTLTTVMIILKDVYGCERFKLVDCVTQFVAIRTETFIPIATESGQILIPEQRYLF